MEQEIREALEKATPRPWDYEVDLVNDEWLTRWIGNGERIIVDNIERYNHETHEGYTSEQMDLDLYLIANAPTYLEWCLSQIAELRKENEDIKYDVGMMHYELKQLDPILEMPSRGFVRNGYNSIVRMAAKWSED